MASTATLVDTEPAYLSNGIGPVYEYEVSLDGVDPAVVRTPATGKRIWAIGLLEAETNAGNLILISNSASPSKTKTLELAANQAIYDKVTPGYIFSTKSGEDFALDSSMAIGSITVRVVESDVFYVR